MIAFSGRMRSAYHGEASPNGYFADEALLGASFFDRHQAVPFGQVSTSASSANVQEKEASANAIHIGTDFNITGFRWTHTTITWSFEQGDIGRNGHDFYAGIGTNGNERSIVRQAFQMWDNAATNLTFVEVADSQSVDIRIGWGYALEDDAVGTTWSFSSGTHAFTAANDIYDTFVQALIFIDFEDDYSDLPGGTSADTPFLNTVLHEIGHAVGLDHWDVSGQSAIMNAVASDLITLTSHEINGVNYLYPTSNPGGNTGGDYTVTITGVSATSVSAGQTVTVNYRISNIGSQTANTMEWRFYLSQDTTISPTNEVVDRNVGTGYVLQPLAAGASQTGSITFTVPSGISGTWYLGMVADYGNYVTEASESNNVSNLYTFQVATAPANRAPTVTASQANVAATPGQAIALSSLFSASDPDGNALTYYVYDGNASAGSGRVILNGTAIPAGTSYQMTAAQFAQATFVAGTSGTDNIAVQVSDGQAYSGNAVVSLSVNNKPVVTAPQANVTANAGQTIALSTLFRASDADGDALTYYVYDGNAAAGSGRVMLNGTTIPAGSAYQMTAAQFAQATFVAGAGGSADNISVQVYDGKTYSGWNTVVRVSVNNAPVVTTPQANVTVAAGQTIALSSLFGASDADGDALTYYVYDGSAGAGSGRVMLNGSAIPAGTSQPMTAAQFAQATFVAGVAGNADDITVRVFDGKAYSGWTNVRLTVPNHAPVVTAPQANVTAAAGQTIALSSLFSASDSDGNALTYYVYDSNSGANSGRVMLNGAAIPAGAGYQMTAAQFAQATFVAGIGNVADDIAVRVFDGKDYSGWSTVRLSVPNHTPVVTVPQANVKAVAGQTIALSSLFSASDVDGDALAYFVYDGNAGASSGRVMLNGTAIPAGAGYQMTAAQFAQATFVAGAGGTADNIAVQVFDGKAYSGWSTVVQVSVNNAPVVTTPQANVTATGGQTFALSNLFSASDSDGDALTYVVYDSNAGANSGRVMLNGTAIPAGAGYQMTAAQFAQATFVAGVGNVADDIAVRAFDGKNYSGWSTARVSVPNHTPVVTAPQANVKVAAGQTIALSSLFSASDIDGDALAYYVYDGNAGAGSGRFMLNGTTIAATTSYQMTAAQFAQATFVAGASGVADDIAVQVFDGKAYSGWNTVVRVAVNNTPIVTAPQANLTATVGQTITLTSMFNASDVDGDALTYFVYDGNAGANSGRVMLNGTAIPAGAGYQMTATQFAQATFVAGATGSTDNIAVQVYDGKAYSGWNTVVQVSVPNRAPIVTAPQANVTATSDQSILLSSLFAASDADGDALTYFVYDGNPGAGSGRVMLNGTTIPAGTGYQMTAAQFAQASFIAGDGGTADSIAVQVFDGKAYSGWNTVVQVSVPNHAPTVSTPAGTNYTASAGQSIPVSALFSGNDSDGDALTYYLYDSNTSASSGRFMVGGNVVPAQAITQLTATQFGQATFVTGAGGTYDDLLVQTFDGKAYSGWNANVHVDVPAGANHAPTFVMPSGSNVSAIAGVPIQLSALFSARDLDGDTLSYMIFDNSPAPQSSYYMVDGTPVPSNVLTVITAAQFAQATFVPSGIVTTEQIMVQVSDGTVVTNSSPLQVTWTSGNHAPMVGLPAGASVDANPGQSLALSSLFRGSDVDGNALSYFVYDGSTAANSGHFVVGGNVVAAGTSTPVTAAQLAQATFVAGAAGTYDDIFVQAFDGQLYSGWNAGVHVFV